MRTTARRRTDGNGSSRILGNRNQVIGLSQQPSALKRDLKWLTNWREQFNPLRGLKMDRVVTLLDGGRQGQYTDLQWTYWHIERRNPVHSSLIRRRQASILKLNWGVKVPEEDDLPEGVTAEQAEAQKEFLEATYGRLDNMREALRHLALAEFRGYSHLQIQRNPAGEAVHLECTDQWCWLRDGMYGEWLWNPEAKNVLPSSLRSDPNAKIDTAQWIIRECELPINEIALPLYLYKCLATKDWAGFLEIYGIPSGIAIMPEGIKDEKTRTEYEELAAQVANGSGGVLPFGSDYKPNDQPRGVNPFREYLRYVDEELVLAGTGGKLTMLTESGSGTLAGGAHQETWDEIAEGEAADISEVFQRQFDSRELDRAFPGQPRVAYFEIAAKDEEDIDALVKNVATLKQAGYVMDAEDLSERTGYDLEKTEPLDLGAAGASAEDDETKPPLGRDRELGTARGAVARNRAVKNRDAAGLVAGQLGINPDWLGPVAGLLNEMLAKAKDSSLTDADLLRALQELEAKLPELFGTMDHAALADVLRGAMGQAAIEGAKDALSSLAKGR